MTSDEDKTKIKSNSENQTNYLGDNQHPDIEDEVDAIDYVVQNLLMNKQV